MNTDIQEILKTSKRIAVVGLSEDPSRDSYQVAQYLQKMGYKIIPVNPKATEILGEKAYPDLKSIPGEIDIVNVFRKPEALPQIVDQAIQAGAKTIWAQLGISHPEAEAKARGAGLKVVANECIAVQRRLLR